MGQRFHNIEFSSNFLDMTPKAQDPEEETMKITAV